MPVPPWRDVDIAGRQQDHWYFGANNVTMNVRQSSLADVTSVHSEVIINPVLNVTVSRL